jgi:hypothetical protein
MANALVSATDLAATAADRPAADLVVTALALALAALAVMDLADLAAMIVVTMTAALPALKTPQSFVQSSPAPSSPMT